MAIATSKTREQFPLSRKKILKKTLTGTLILDILFLLICLPFGATLLAISQRGDLALVFGIGIVVFLLLLTMVVYLYQIWYFNVYFYDLTPDYIVIRKGPITPHEITVPYERVQDVYVDQDIFDRIFGLYDVHLSSATVSSGMAAHIDGVEKPAADGLKNLLLTTVNSKIGRKPQSTPPIKV